MSLPLVNNQEGGVEGVTVTQGATGNSGGDSGSFFSSVSGNVTFDGTRPGAGSLGLKCMQDPTLAGQAKVGWAANQVGTLASGAVLYERWYIYWPALPAATQTIHTIVSAASGLVLSVRVDATGHVLLSDANGVVQYTSTASLPTGTLIRVETKTLIHATAGHWLGKLYFDDGAGKSAQGTTEVFSVGSDTTAQALRGTADNLNYGLMTSAAGNTLYVSDIAANLTDWPGPSALATPADWYRLRPGSPPTWGAGGQIKRLSGGAWV